MLEFIKEIEEKIRQLEEGSKTHIEQSTKINTTLNVFNGAIQAYQDIINRINAKYNPAATVEAVSDVVFEKSESVE